MIIMMDNDGDNAFVAIATPDVVAYGP